MVFAPQHILVPVALEPEDDLGLAENAVLAACDIAEKFSSRITLVHLAPALIPGGTASFDVTGQIYDSFLNILKARFDFGRMKLDELAAEAKKRGIVIEGRQVESIETTVQVILESAVEINADLIVISSHGRRGLSRVLFGSVAAKVADKARVPVLLLHPERSSEAEKK